MKTYFLRIPDYAGEGFAEITVKAESESDARRIANEEKPPFYWDGATCVEVDGSSAGLTVINRRL